MSTMPKLQCTRNYALFSFDENRKIAENADLLSSMQQYGFLYEYPLAVFDKGNGKLKVKDGHHRLHYAKRLNLDVWYIIGRVDLPVSKIPQTVRPWTNSNYAESAAKRGDPDCKALLAFCADHHIPFGAARNLLAGAVYSGGGLADSVKTGQYRVVDSANAKIVVSITDTAHELGICFARSGAFVRALRLSMEVPQFNSEEFLRKMRRYPRDMVRRATREEYLEEIERLYNRGAKIADRVPLAWMAKQHVTHRGGPSAPDAGVAAETPKPQPVAPVAQKPSNEIGHLVATLRKRWAAAL